MDADGRADALVGCYGDNVARGNALVFNAVRPDVLTDPAAVAGDICGVAAAVGDMNGDGRADVLVGCQGDNSSRGNVLAFTKNAGAGYTYDSTITDPAPAANDFCGYALALADVNADGRADAVIGCYQDNANRGNVLVFTKNAGVGFTWDSTLVDPAPVAGDRCGRSVAAGDLNGDGRADIVTGCDGDNGGRGNVLVFLRNAGVGFTWDSTLTDPGAAATDACGTGISLGDMNADARPDLLVGCYNDNAGQGSAVAFLKNAGAGFTWDSTLVDPGPVAGDQCGLTVALGDANADGRADALIGCYGDNGVRGNALVFLKNAGVGFTWEATLTDPAPAANDYCGDSVAFGDVNGDGRADAIVGCQGNSAFTGNALVFTKNAGAGFTYEVTLTDPAAVAADWCGFWVATGDVNADGRADVVMGCRGDNGNRGNAIVFPSASTARYRGIDPLDAGTLVDPAAVGGDNCGRSVAVGDVNGDGRADALVGCFGDNASAGNALLFTKNAGAGFTYDSTLTDPAPVGNDQCGISVALGDVNADGRADALIGCPNDTGSRGNALLFTKNAGVGFTYDSAIVDPAPVAADSCGIAVALGDVNLDGRADALIGCWGDNGGRGNVLAFLKNAGVGFTWDSTLTDPVPAANDNCGHAIALGDVTADGRADALIGCDGNSTAAGNALTFTKNAGAGFTYDSAIVDPAPVASDRCGISVALGDINLDGRADALIGCWGDNGNRGNALMFAKNVGAGYTYDATLTDPSAAVNDNCGNSVAMGDVNADGRADALIGCMGDNGSRGTALVYTRNTVAGFTWDSALTDPAPVAGDSCGLAIAAGDVNLDGRADAVIGCMSDNAAKGNVVVNSDWRGARVVQSLRVNQISALISAATVTALTVDNGGSVTLEASADGGANWEAVTSGVAHTFVATGSDLRVRATIADNPMSGFQSTPIVHELTVVYTYNIVPDVPALTSPAAAGSTTDTTPDLVATYTDLDAADTGMIGFEVCTVAFTPAQTCAAALGTLLASGSSPAGIVNAASGTWTVTPALIPQIVYWRARATDNGGLVSAWSASRQLTIVETLTINVDSATAAIGLVAPGTDAMASTVVTVTSNDPQGYVLSATDEDDAWGINAGGSTVPDWTGTDVAPSLWTAATSGASGYFGITVRDTTGLSTNRLAKWGTANPAGWPQADLANNLYAGLKLGTSTVLHDTAAAAASDTITTTYRMDLSATTTAGAYDATVIYTVVGKP